jgi:hypothetical protein
MGDGTCFNFGLAAHGHFELHGSTETRLDKMSFGCTCDAATFEESRQETGRVLDAVQERNGLKAPSAGQRDFNTASQACKIQEIGVGSVDIDSAVSIQPTSIPSRDRQRPLVAP